MNALQRIELLTEHANLVQSIPALTGLSKIDSLERLSEIVVLLGGKVQDEALTPEQNIAKGKQAMQSVITNHQDVKHAMYRDDIGWIDFVWGEIGEVKPNGKTKGAMGIAHIIEARMRKDGMSEIQAQDFVNNAIVNALALGKSEVTSKKDTSTKTMVSYNGTIVHLVKNESENAWVLTGYEDYQTMNQSGGATTSDLRTTSPTLSRADVGASDNDNIPQNNDDVNGGTLSQAFYDEFMLKNEMGELVFADDEFVDDVDIETHEKALVDGKTYAFGRALIAIDEVVLSRPMWSVVFGDFNHTLMAVSLFDSIANVDDFSVVAQVGVNLNNPKYKQYVLRLAVSDEGNIIAYPNETGDTALRHTIHYSEKDNVRALINTAIQSIENERKQKDLLAQKQAKETQLNTVNLSKKEIEQAFTGLSGVEIGRAKNQLLKTLTTREFGEQTYKTFIETLIDDKGYQPRIANMMKQKGENAGDTKTVYRIADDDGRGYEINKTQYVYAKWYYEQKQAENEPAPQDDESQKPEHSPSNEDSAGALSQNEQENTMNEPQNTEQPQAKETTGQAVAQILVNEYGWQYADNQRTHIALGRYTNDKFGEFVVSADVKDDDIVANQPLTNVFIGGVRDVVQDAKDFHRRALDWLDGYQSKAVGKNAPEPNQNAEPTQEDKPMNEPQNPNYTQSDIDYMQSIINGTLDLETVDMDKMIEIGEKDEHDPMYEQALQVVSDYLDKMTSV